MTKYKVALSYKTYHCLQSDMHEFNFYKPNGEVNQNKFYNTIIQNFYNNLKERKKYIKEVILDNFSNILNISNQNELLSAIDNINYKLNEIHHSDMHTSYHHYNIYIQATKSTIDLYETIETNELNQQCMSEFLRNLLNEYVKMPMYEREKCIFWENYKKFQEAIYDKRIIYIKTITYTSSLEFLPISVLPSNYEDAIYVIGKISSDSKRKFTSIRLSNITQITFSEYNFSIANNEINNLKKQTIYGPEFISDTTIHTVLKLTKTGQKMFDLIFKERPMPTDYSDDGKFVFDCTEERIFSYFKQFGKEVEIISPKKLKDKLNKFHKDAIKN